MPMFLLSPGSLDGVCLDCEERPGELVECSDCGLPLMKDDPVDCVECSYCGQFHYRNCSCACEDEDDCEDYLEDWLDEDNEDDEL